MTTPIIVIIVLVLVFLILVGPIGFNKKIEKERKAFFAMYPTEAIKISGQELQGFPPLMKTYLKKVGVLGKLKNCTLAFKQKGQIKTNPKKGWINFTANQYMTAIHPGFIWKAKAFPMYIRDKSIKGKGEVKISILGLRDIMVFDGYKTNQSALGRCLGELVFFPIAFLSEDISWEPINGQSVMATLTIGGESAKGIFYFDKEGLIERFETLRYRDENLERFTGKALDYTIFGDLLIPTKMIAIWNLPEGDLEYFKATISDYKIE